MVEGTLETLEAFLLLTNLRLIHKWMELLLFPAMTKLALFKSFASLFVTCYEGAWLPVFTKFSIIPEKIRFSPEILKVMRVHTLGFVMLVIIRAPFSFEEEDVKVEILILG